MGSDGDFTCIGKAAVRRFGRNGNFSDLDGGNRAV